MTIKECFLLADIGGTNCRLEISDSRERKSVYRKTYATRDYHTFDLALESFLADVDFVLRGTCIAVAGPVRGCHAQLTNCPWSFNASQLQELLGVPSLLLINDLEATARAVHCLPAAALHRIGGIGELGKTSAVVALGTGFGGALLHRLSVPLILAGEPGHAAFAPENTEEDLILSYLRSECQDARVEHLLSGPGLVRLHNYFALSRESAAPKRDAPEIIAAAQHDDLCRSTLDHFCRLLGAACANLALGQGADSVVLCADLSRALLPTLSNGGFRERFERRSLGRFLRDVPVFVSTTPDLALSGAYWSLVDHLQERTP